ncbi:MAG TPA: undecaprenyl-phosphate glucose phosphotransferase [Mesorhizobium sp.]|nr:undecaprenyl-phosphate glucose phosphotransferase [Mesorhizobium sp.]
MNEIDPAHRFSLQAVKPLDGGAGPSSATAGLNGIAAQVAAQYRRNTLSPVMVRGLVRLAELAILIASGGAIYALHVDAGPGLFWAYAAVVSFASLCALLLLEASGAYQIGALMRPSLVLRPLVLCWSATMAALALAGFFLKVSADFSRLWLGGWFLAGLALLVLFRLALAWFIRRWARNGTMERRAVIVGGGKEAEKLIRSIELQPFSEIRICGIFDDRDDTRSPPVVAGCPKLGTVAELVEFARVAQIDMLIVALPLTAERRVLHLLKQLWVLPVDIRLSAHSNQLRFRPRSYSFIGSVPMHDLFDKPITDWNSVAKRAFDIVFSLLAIVALSPVMVATAIAIKLDSKGPVLFKQKRHGFNNQVIEVLKFRSMYVDKADQGAKKLVTKGDPRVTRVGRIIRKTSIDELPQFFNALIGTLSLVGPRPHAPSALARDRLYWEVVDGYFARHKVKPGVTGWAQINGWRGETDSDEKIKMRTEFDLFYIENWSLWFDLKILFLTPIRLLNTENAY